MWRFRPLPEFIAALNVINGRQRRLTTETHNVGQLNTLGTVPEKSIGRLRAVIDAVQVFIWTLAVLAAVHWLFGSWQRITGWPVAEYSAMLTFPFLWIYWSGADVADYGLQCAGIRQQLEAAVRCAVPFTAFAGTSFINWGGFAVFVTPAVGIAALFLFGYVLRNRSTSKVAMAPCLLLAFSLHGMSSAAVGVAFYLLLLGPAEEVLFRGIIQSRLNLGFGRPFVFLGARWGWGAIIAGSLFGVMHVLNLPALFEGHWHPNWWAGPVMFCFALPFAYLRERTGGVIAPALLHAYPQAIVFAIRSMTRT
jgi:membrane protease YdiL (CAAX protease family)